MEIFLAILFFFFGCIVGSFLNVVILRLPEGKKLTGRSHCMSCGHTLSAGQLVPLFSYLILRGRCKWCGKKFSPRYFFIELTTGLLFALTYAVIEPSGLHAYLLMTAGWVVAATAVSVFVIDLEHYLILDAVIFPALVLMLLLSVALDVSGGIGLGNFGSATIQAITGALAGALPFFAVWWLSKGSWMGFGDVKLMLFIGASVGLKLVGISVLIAVLAGGLVSVYLLLSKKKGMKSSVPFGTFLAPATFVVFLYGQQILDWYLSLIWY